MLNVVWFIYIISFKFKENDTILFFFENSPYVAMSRANFTEEATTNLSQYYCTANNYGSYLIEMLGSHMPGKKYAFDSNDIKFYLNEGTPVYHVECEVANRHLLKYFIKVEELLSEFQYGKGFKLWNYTYDSENGVLFFTIPKGGEIYQILYAKSLFINLSLSLFS